MYACAVGLGVGANGMRPRAIQGVPGLDSRGSPFERFKQFARMLATVSKAEADKGTEKAMRATRRSPQKDRSDR
jgi:hypothetical protein